MNELHELSGDRFQASELTGDDEPELQRLLEDCADYYELVLGRPPGPAEAQSVFCAGPEDGRSPKDKMLLGIRTRDGQDLVGVLDGFRDYPAPGVWYIGLLLLAPHARIGGIGKDVVESFASVAKAGGARELQLNVVEQNEAAYRFWTRCGFQEVRRWRQLLGERESTFIRMRSELPLSQSRRLERLSAAVQAILSREEYGTVVARLKRQVEESAEPFVWSAVNLDPDLLRHLPEDIKSAWIFVLKRETWSGAHFHPNSIQHMVMIEGRGLSHIGSHLQEMVRFEDAARAYLAWMVIPEGLAHEFLPEGGHMVVISFHTCPANALIEVDAVTGMTRIYE